ncbi:Uncharacterised protein [Mycobacterium tuberculosis]|uniref:Uncharacterized protein n=1 Tax=Mycobacterium tuberculosis TaxID=1773 RepID=A0A0T9CCF2_MYCTX|nr:Uncharacterised protein [Mycobacterium tuberculosis]CKR26983.1 Uncharacterised protein [Mycobacterium tuberculosis]CKR52234.1 Uncharacterised protein [Mycobacterium tuberculosis]CKR55723.1 Uncharacterised protein [Mycobacterium tuberculosis]CKT51136.1 Uncharacterised protein [Mycobacterium tuberculosis]
MDHHGHRNVIERPGLQHQRLTAAGLLGRGPQQSHGQAQVVRHLSQCQRGAHSGGRNNVVPAGVSDPGKRVVLGAHSDNQRSAAVVGAKRRVQPTGGRGDLETAFGDQRLSLGAAAMLGERQLGLGVDGMGQLDQLATTAPHQFLDAVGCAGCWHARSISSTSTRSPASGSVKLAQCG